MSASDTSTLLSRRKATEQVPSQDWIMILRPARSLVTTLTELPRLPQTNVAEIIRGALYWNIWQKLETYQTNFQILWNYKSDI
jgi:hypothetical protein